jgi:hypothetical protein
MGQASQIMAHSKAQRRQFAFVAAPECAHCTLQGCTNGVQFTRQEPGMALPAKSMTRPPIPSSRGVPPQLPRAASLPVPSLAASGTAALPAIAGKMSRSFLFTSESVNEGHPVSDMQHDARPAPRHTRCSWHPHWMLPRRARAWRHSRHCSAPLTPHSNDIDDASSQWPRRTRSATRSRMPCWTLAWRRTPTREWFRFVSAGGRQQLLVQWGRGGHAAYCSVAAVAIRDGMRAVRRRHDGGHVLHRLPRAASVALGRTAGRSFCCAGAAI